MDSVIKVLVVSFATEVLLEVFTFVGVADVSLHVVAKVLIKVGEADEVLVPVVKARIAHLIRKIVPVLNCN